MPATIHRRLKYEPGDYELLRIYKCTNYVGRKLLQNVFEWGLQLPENETLKEHIVKKNNYSNHAYKKRYDEGQKKLIEAYDEHIGEKFDVTILYKLIQDTSCNIAPIYDKLWITPNSSQLEYLLYSIKCLRNEIAHGLIPLNHASSHQMIEKCRNDFSNLIEAAGVRYERNVTTERTDLNTDFDEIINHPLIENEINQLFREQIHEKSKNKMVTEGGQEMKEKYNKQSDLNPLSLIDGTNFRLPVKKVYKKMEIRDCGRHSKNIFIDTNDILRLTDSCQTVKELNEAVDLVILEGPTGSGKTTITKLILSEWSTNSSCLIKGILEYNILIYMECRNPNIESLNELLHYLMPSTCNNLGEDPAKTLSACTVLIIIDSLDELNEQSEMLVKELLELMMMKNVTGICTMRPTKAQDVFTLIPSELTRVHLKSRGIPDDQRGSFVEMYHKELLQQGKSDQSTQELMQHVSKSSIRLQEHLRYPINLVHLVYLWAIAPQKVKFITTATELYSSIHEVVQIHLSERLIHNALTKHLKNKEREEQIQIFLKALYMEAMVNLTKQHFCILPKDSETVLETVCEANSLPKCEMLSAFLVTKSLWSGLTVETEYRISHTDMQEYLAACCIFNAVRDHKFENKLVTRICCENKSRSFRMNSLRRSLSRSNSIVKHNPITDVLQLFFPNSNIPIKDYQNVLKHLSGLFVLNKKSMCKDEAKDLVNLLKMSGMEQSDDWLDIYAETKGNKFMEKCLRDLCSNMLCGDITIRDSRLAAYAILLTPDSSHGCRGNSACAVRAKSIIINLKNPPSELPGLQVVMSHAIKLKCNVEVHLYYNWRNPCSGGNTALFNETHIRCNLVEVRGSPTSNELRTMYSTLEKLYISICCDNHARDVLPIIKSEEFSKLKSINVHLKCGDVSSEALLPLDLYKSTTKVLFLSDVDDNNVAWAAGVARALQLQNGEYDCLYLPNNQLTSAGFLNLVQCLHQQNVKIVGRIGITSEMNEEDLEEAMDAIKAAAWNQLQCGVLWYFSAERMEGW
ncbi:unnamed protein product [Meganyctiphanes norvegica]|uniref:NACHT domain-containing protein n=1 Tax=Meganyctiphanes norvegica TaxID=48144 RepID=A0AAV2QYD5_MEGNR